MKKFILAATILFAMFSIFARDDEFIAIFNQGTNEEIYIVFYDDFTFELLIKNDEEDCYIEGTCEFKQMFGMYIGVLTIKDMNETMGLLCKDNDIILRIGETFITGGKIIRNPQK